MASQVTEVGAFISSEEGKSVGYTRIMRSGAGSSGTRQVYTSPDEVKTWWMEGRRLAAHSRESQPRAEAAACACSRAINSKVGFLALSTMQQRMYGPGTML